ncbi:hypothetical protein L6452_41179 [Arctium lappa]|uniref:Uncharacterized protein n=1 Tax=Arctium lappa TaxID=4217 RepID=A0ACB8XNJ3_ARCLA|nr:hypothetical protein L6452_41179 [Arctium lappa]
MVDQRQLRSHFALLKLKVSGEGKLITCEKLNGSRASSFLCRSRETQTAETEEFVSHNEDCSKNFSRTKGRDGQHIHPERIGKGMPLIGADKEENMGSLTW